MGRMDRGEGQPERKPMPKYMNFLIGGASGTLSVMVVQPADLLKTRMQLLGEAGKKMSLLGVARNIVRKEGILGFYVGLSAAVLRQVTYGTGRLGCFGTLFDMYDAKYGTNPPLAVKLGMGLISGAFGAFVGNPSEVALIRMTADGRLPMEQRRNYKNVFNALFRITREEGFLTLWRGVNATITRSMIVAAAQLGSYAQAREMLLPRIGDGLMLHSFAAMISGLVTTVASLPVDIVKTRVQNAEKGTSQIAVLKNVIAKEGFFALWSGLIPTSAKLGPMTILIFVFLEQFNNLYYRLTE